MADPLDDRLRATFEAEHAEVERRHLDRASSANGKGKRQRIPFAAAAGIIAMLGLFFISARSGDDQVVDVGVAAEPTATAGPIPDASTTPDEPAPEPTATVLRADALEPFPARNECGQPVPLVRHFVWDIAADAPESGLLAYSTPDESAEVTRVLSADEVVEPTRGCVRSANGTTWYQIFDNDGMGDWVDSRHLRATTEACRVVTPDGPVEGLAVVDVERIAFFEPSVDPNRYRWYSANEIAITRSCSSSGADRGPVCLSPAFEVRPITAIDEPFYVGPSGTTAWRTGNIVTTPTTYEEVYLFDEQGDLVRGFVNADAHYEYAGNCLFTGDDSLAAQQCTRVAASERTAGVGGSEAGQNWSTTGTDSQANHILDVRAESNATCSRIVVEFGAGSGDSRRAAALPPSVTIAQALDFVEISPAGEPWQPALGNLMRADYDHGTALLSLSFNYEFAVKLMHEESVPHVRLFRDPARIVIDVFPTGNDGETATGPFGERFVLRQPIQQDLTGPGIPEQNGVVVAGFGRPFEAAGLYRIWAVPDDTDPYVFLADPPEPFIEDFFPTAGWAEAWGEFFVDLPDLAPGTYIAVFGELPPTDEIGFYGAGQLFRVADPDAPPGTTYPEAVLLPDVQLPPES